MSNISRRSFLKGAGVAALAVAAAGVLAGCSDKETPDTGAKRDVKLKYLSTSAGKVFGDVVIQVPALATTVSFATIQANKPAAAEGYDFISTEDGKIDDKGISDSPEMQAARNFVVNGRYAEARRVLDGMTARNARWYYLSSLANQGLGNSIDALQDARRAVQLDPNNTEYRMHLQRLQNPGRTYRTQTTYAQPGGIMRWCWSMILLNLLCNCCCGGWGFYGFRR